MTIFGTMNSKGEVTEHLELDLSKMPSSDPLAFAYGVSQGQSYIREKKQYSTFIQLHGSNYSEVAKEYLRGCKVGATGILLPEGYKIPKGCEFNYFGHEDAIK